MLNVKKANLLKAEVGDGSDTKIWSKAKDLHTKTNTLATATGVSSNNELKGLAEALRDAVGRDEHVDGLQKALKDLKNATDTAQIVKKAKEVISKYDAVKEAYDKVKAKETSGSQYTNALGVSDQQKYTQVTTDFEALETAYNNGKFKAISPIFDKEMIRYCSI